MKVFIDSDVIISSLLSSSGAAYLLINTEIVIKIISSFSQREIEAVVDRLGINKQDFNRIQKEKLEVISIPQTKEDLKKTYQDYVLDINDAHIIAGAKEAQVRFLITYNLKDYKLEKIKQVLNIIMLTPGQFLQYLRSLK